MEPLENGSLTYSVMDFETWRKEIAPLWLAQGSYASTQKIIHGFGQLQYCGKDLFERILLFPVCATLRGQRVAWTSVYNISETALRVRGIYVLPQFRSQGIGRKMVDYATANWPEKFSSTFIYARGSTVNKYLRWGFRCVENHSARSTPEQYLPGEKSIVLMVRERQQLAAPCE
jgi:GNAT superfamily N-acetyltransferase